MLHMQHAQLALLLMEPSRPKLQFPAEDRDHQRRLERIRDSLLARAEARADGRSLDARSA